MIFKSLCNVCACFALALLLASCGGGGSDASPGAIIVEAPDDGGGGGGGGGGPVDPGPVNPPDPGEGGIQVGSLIPSRLESVIRDSGRTASAEFGGRPIYTINAGELDPAGLVIGNDRAYQISGGALRIVPPDGGGDCVLEMAPGAVMAGGSASDFLVIGQGCRINADGTAAQPVIFTALAEISGDVEDGDRGLWGGLVINGRAPVNHCPEGAAGGTDGCVKEGEANSGAFGGADPNDNSGTLRYVSVRFAGSNVDPENQLNGIAFQGVGDATTVEHVQVHNNLDDGIEFFGGTVNARWVALTGNADDSLDWTDGWRGKIQYLYIEQTDSADNGIEADNREGDENAMPASNPSIANMSIFGNPGERALRLRRGTGLTLTNSFIEGAGRCLRVDGASRNILGSAGDPAITFQGVSFACATTHDRDDDGAVQAYLGAAINVSQDGDNVDPVPVGDAFFTNEDFIGAIGATDWTEGWVYPGSVNKARQVDLGCPEGTAAGAEAIGGKRVCQLSGTIVSDLLLTSNNLYELVGKVVVGEDNTNSAVLTIQAGTTIFGGSTDAFLQISRGSKIIANGTRMAPVVMTAAADLRGRVDIDADRGLWGGLVINGNAPINDCPEGASGGTAGCTKEGEANSGTFGGDDPDDNSGALNHVVVKFAGANVDPENQLNGIAFSGVGRGTEVDYVQVHNNLDDGIEFFGGTVNARHVVLTGNADDSLDWTDGWQGAIQYLVIKQSDDAADNGIEADNREGDEAAEPRSLPKIANMTIAGNSSERGIRLRRGTGLELYNSVVRGSRDCLRVQGDSLNQLGAGIRFGGVSLGCATAVEGDDVAAIQAELDTSENVSTTGAAVGAVSLAGHDFFDDTDFIGAMENEENDWTTGWTTGWTVGNPTAIPGFGCPFGAAEIAPVDGSTTSCQLSGTIASDLTLVRGNYYVLDGAVFVGGDNKNSATLTIESGTTIIGDDPEDFLVVSRGSRIIAKGTAAAPVTMTAVADVLGEITNPASTRGLWGGLVINGNAPINHCPEGASGGTPGCVKEGEANSGTFGGDDPGDSSGLLNYVVVKFAGANVDPENQLNGIAFQGVGSGTQVDYVQVYNNLDDGVEFFGGTVFASHLVLVGNADDSLDWTDGWRGGLQYVHIVQADDAGDQAIEADNREGDELASPVSRPTITNMTIMGNPGENGIRLRRGTGLQLLNSSVSGSGTCLRVDGQAATAQLGDGISLAGVSLGCAAAVNSSSTDEAAVRSFLDSAANVTQDGAAPTPVPLPGGFDADGNGVIGSDFRNWGRGWTVGF